MSLTIHQLVPYFSYGDAITNQVLSLQKILRRAGHTSEIYASFIDKKRLPGLARQKEKYDGRADILIYHYSSFDSQLEVFRDFPGRKILIYHNVTPAYFFVGQSKSAYVTAVMSREILGQLAEEVDLALADSSFNEEELKQLGFGRTGVLPIVIDFGDWKKQLELTRSEPRRDDLTNILFVSRITPNKRQDELLDVFAIYQRYFRPASRLILVGQMFEEHQNYTALLRDKIKTGNLSNVEMPGQVDFPTLVKYYRQADLYVSLSDHEGFGVPLLEAMFCRVPVLAYTAGAVAETLGGAGVLVRTKEPEQLAEMIESICRQPARRDRIIAGQDQRLAAYRSLPFEKIFLDHLRTL